MATMTMLDGAWRLLLAGLVLGACADDGDTRSDTGGSDTGGADAASDTLAADTHDDTADDVGAEVADVSGPPSGTWRLRGLAQGEVASFDTRVECTFDVTFMDFADDGAGGWTAFASGEVFRNVFPGSERYEFSAFVGGEATLELTAPDAGVLRFVGDQPDDAAPFWRAIEALPVTRSASGWQAGFSCAPIGVDFGGYTDDKVSVGGTLTLEPEPSEAIIVDVTSRRSP